MNYQGPATILAVSTAKNGNMYLSITENVIKNISDSDTRANHAHDLRHNAWRHRFKRIGGKAQAAH